MFLRTFRTGDLEALVELTVRAFAPIQHGIRDQLGEELFARQNGNWRQDYRDTLEELTDPEDRHRVLVAELFQGAGGRGAQFSLRVGTTSTGLSLSWSTAWETEPSSSPRNPPMPREPTTTRSAVREAVVRIVAGRPT